MEIQNKHIFWLIILMIVGYVLYETYFEKKIKEYFKKK